MNRKQLKKSKRIVIKVGTNIIMKNNRFNSALVNNLAEQASALRRQGKEIILVSSGAIGLGLEKMNINKVGVSIPMQQAMASVGQNLLMTNYEKVFSKYNQVIAQLLLMQQNFSNAKALGNLKNNLNKLLSMNIIPIINENDAVAVDELQFKNYFSDNDMLAALTAYHTNADLLVMLSDVDGLYDTNPQQNRSAKRISEVRNPQQLNVSVLGASSLGRGGFKSKIEAARFASKKMPVVIALGRKNVLKEVLEGKNVGTFFNP